MVLGFLRRNGISGAVHERPDLSKRASQHCALGYATDQAALTLNSYANENDPFADIGQRSVTVDVTSIVRSSEDSFEVRWREKSFRNGAQLSVQTYTASLSIITKPPTDAETLHRNPLGLYVHGLHWSKDLNATGASQ